MTYGQGLNSKELTEIIIKSKELAQHNRAYTVDPVHILMALLDKDSLEIKKVIKINREIKEKIQEYLDKQPKAPNHATPQINEVELSRVLEYSKEIAQKEKSVIKEIHILYGTLKSNSVQTILSDIDVQSIIKKIESTREREESGIENFAVDMVQQAKDGLFDPVIGRDNEIRSILEILTKKIKSNAMLLGEPGVGKTAIVNGLAQLIANNQAPSLVGCTIYNVDLGALVAGAMYHGQFEERLKTLIKAAEESNRKTILFIDEIHMVLGAGKTQGAMNAANLLKPGLASGAIRCIGATTYIEYKQYVEKDPAFERRFVRVSVAEPSVDDTVTILRGLRERFESYHGLNILNETLECAAEMAGRYLKDGNMPDTAITLVDAACASVKVALETEPVALMKLKSKIWAAEIEKQSILTDAARDVNMNRNEKLTKVQEKIDKLYEKLIPIEKEHNEITQNITKRKKLKTKLESLKIKLADAERTRNTSLAYDIKSFAIPQIKEELKKIEEEDKDSQICIFPVNVAEIVSNIKGIPLNRLTQAENKRLQQLELRLSKKVVGQEESIHALTNAIIRSKAGFGRPGRPVGSFLFLGPTGVGKTQLAKTLAYELFDNENAMVRIDMSEYMEEHSVSKLLGSPPGYIGYEAGGYLTEKIKNKPYSIILIDEIEKAHKRVLNIFLQVLDDGHLTDSQGRKVDFTNTVIIMTSNLGSDNIMNSNIEKEAVMASVKRFFSPEFINRLDGVEVFNPLSEESLLEIVDIYIKDVNSRLKKQKISVILSANAMQKIIQESYTREYGARPIQRFIEQTIVTDISRIFFDMDEMKKPVEIAVFSNDEVASNTEISYQFEFFSYLFK